MLRKIICSTLLCYALFHPVLFGQNAIVGTGFSSGWGGAGCPTGNSNFTYLTAGAGSSYIATLNANGTGNQYFRFGIDWSGTTAQRTITPGSDNNIFPSSTYTLNSSCTSNGAMYFNVGSTAYNYVFKTANAGTNPTGNFVVFEVQGAIRSVSAVTQAPLTSSVTAGSTVTVSAELNGALSAGQQVYLRYSTNSGFASSSVVSMTGSGTTYTGAIPSGVNTAGTTVYYYVFTSGPSNVAIDGSNADLYTINFNNNGGTNYSYTVLTPTTIYEFTNSTSGAYNSIANFTTASNLTRQNGANAPGSPCGAGFNVTNFSNTTTYSTALANTQLIFSPNSGYSLQVSSISVDQRRSGTGPASIRLAYSIDGGSTWIDQGSNLAPNNSTCGNTTTGTWSVSVNADATNGLRLRLYGFNASATSGTLQILNLRINGNVVALPGAASNSSDIIDNTSYATGSPEFNSNPSYILYTDGTATTAGKIIPMKFKIRDGGAGLNDADNLPTTLTGITFNVTNTSSTNRGNFIKQAILTTSGGTVIGTASSITASQIIFTGLSDAAFTVADNTETATNLHLRIAFDETTVIDNEKLVFTVAAATAGASGSQFAAANAGGAQTDNLTSNDRNRIEVIATALAFVQQPGNTGFGQTMTPNPTIEAIDANLKRDLDFANGIVLTSSGTMTGAPITVNASSGLATYTSVVHTAVQTGVQLTASYAGLTSAVSNSFNVAATSGTTDHFRTATGFTTGNWNSTGTWESSPDNSTWVAATQTPTSAASSVTIRTGAVTISTPQSAKLLTIQAGAVLVHNAGTTFTIADDGSANHDFVVQGRYEINGEQPTLNSGATGIIYTNAEVRANDNFGSPGTSDDFARNTSISWQHNSLYNWNTTNAFETSAATYFPNTPEGTIPIFRISANTNAGAGSTTTINGILEIAGSATFTWNNAGDKVFRNGIQGSGTLIQNSGNCGRYVINGNTSVLGFTSGLSLRNNAGSGIVIQSGVCTILNNTTTNSGPVSVSNGAMLVAGTYVMSGSASFTLNAGATLSSAHANGVNGNIAVSEAKDFVSGSNYIFNGSVNQTTGALMALSTGSLTIANTGTAGNNTVTLTTNNTSTNALNLNSGLFAAGTGQTLEINNTGSVTSIGGEVVTTAAGGNIWLKGNNTVTGYAQGTPHFYDLTIGSGIAGSPVTLTNNPTVHHYCTLNSQAAFNGIAAPTYATGSTLIYNTTGTYNRGIEWGSAAGNPGYPWHVMVQNGTTIQLGIGGTPTVLETGGNLNLGNGTTTGFVNMNALAQTLTVKGNLTIGDGTTVNNALTLSTAIGGDLVVHGNFTRYDGSFYNDNSRAIFFRGSSNSTISIPGLIPPAAGSPNPTLQDYGYTIIDKDVATAKVILNAPVGVTEKLTLTRGIIAATSHGLFIKKPSPDATNEGIAGGSIDSYVDGRLYRYMSVTTNGLYSFPIGKSDVGSGVFKPVVFTTTNHLSPGAVFSAEYFGGVNATPLYGPDENFLGTLQGVLRDEFWQFNKVSGAAAAAGKLAVKYDYNAGNVFRDADNNVVPVCADCNVAVVKRDSDVGVGNWEFTKADYTFDVYDATYPEARLFSQSGFIQSGELSSFSPFTVGFNFNNILGTLPVKLLSFDGQLQQQQAKLTWTIDSDKDVRHFELQHSTDGSSFTSIRKMQPAGNSYSIAHQPYSSGKQFYRLKVVEKNGTSFYSKTVLLITGNSSSYMMGLQSTIVQQQAVINLWSAQNQAAQTSLYDANGKLLAQQQQQILRGDNQLKVTTQHLAQGVYFLHVYTADGIRQTLRFIKE